jgi:hypothetical protein
MFRFSMAFDDPRSIAIRQSKMHAYQLQAQQRQNKKIGDLSTSMIDRVHRAKPGCGACGK